MTGSTGGGTHEREGDANVITIDVVASGALAASLPAGERRGRARVGIPARSSVADLLVALGIPPARPLLIVLNGTIVTPDERATRSLADGDGVSLAPPIRAG